MISTILHRLRGDDFRDKVAFAATPSVLRHALLRTDEVAALRRAIESGAILPSEIQDFVESLLIKFRVGERFPDDFALAAVAVAVENTSLPFAKEYLDTLAGLHLAELSVVSAIARECLKNQLSQTIVAKLIKVRSALSFSMFPQHSVSLLPAKPVENLTVTENFACGAA